MIKLIKLFFKARKDYKIFQSLSLEEKSIVFYAENNNSMAHTNLIVEDLTGAMQQKICYLTSCDKDPILRTNNKNIKAFYIGDGTVRTVCFLNLEAKVMIMDMPDLETYHIKRSKLFKVHYIYIFHSIASTHMNYREGAFDHFDSIFCVGPHHINEIRKNEEDKNLCKKNLVKYGYGRLDNLLSVKNEVISDKQISGDSLNKVLLAPSWGAEGLLETRGLEVTKILLSAGYHVTVRPHPMTCRKWPQCIESLSTAFKDNPNFVLEKEITSKDSFMNSDCLIATWGGMALEYAFTLEKFVIFIDVPKKVNNPKYVESNLTPVEISIREKIGVIISTDKLAELPDKINTLSKQKNRFSQNIREVREETIFNIGKSAHVGTQSILDILKNRE